MGKKAIGLGLLILALAASGASAQERQLSSWTLYAAPQAGSPVVSGDFGANELISTSLGGSLMAECAFPVPLPLGLRMGLSYSNSGFLPTGAITTPGTLNELSILGGIGWRLHLGQALALNAFLDAGPVMGIVVKDSVAGTPAFYALVRAGAGMELALSRSLSARLDASFDYHAGLFGGIGATLGMGYRLPAPAQSGGPARIKLLDFPSVKTGNIFPIFRGYYDQHALGTVRIANTGKEAATNLRVSFIIRQYMDAPKECASIDRIEPGKSVELPLYALFNDDILGVTEPTKVSGEIAVEYGEGYSQTKSVTVTVQDRNALTWSDDRHAAAFVSNKDPWVQELTGHILAAVKSDRNPELARNMQTAIAIHQGLGAYGLGYMLSTARPSSQEAWNPEVVDTLKFPRQTLGFRSGDCADLSVLYASCFEAAGVETAFVTVPGHIFMAFDLGLGPAEALARGIDARELISQGGRLWLPLETTMRDSGFLEVWRKAAEQWRASSSKGQAAFYPIHDAWKTFAPVGLPADGSNVVAPADAKINEAFKAELARAVDAELTRRISALGSVQSGAQGAVDLNSRGILFGKYGRFAEAEKDFKAAAKTGSVSALVNLGNISFMKTDYASALAYYQQAAKQSPQNTKILVNLARAAAALGKSDLVTTTLDTIRRLDPQTADRYEALAQAGTASGTRAAEQEAAALEWL